MPNKEKVLTLNKKFGADFWLKWEMILVYILVFINLVLIALKPELYFKPGTISSMIQSGLEFCPLILGMTFIMMLGDIDVSCSSIMIFCAMVTGMSMDAGMPVFIAVILGLVTGVALGALNGAIIAYIGFPAVITTIATSLLFRGLVRIILDINVLTNFPQFYSTIAWSNILGIPVAMILFLLLGAVFAIVLHKTEYGRQLYMIGNNALTTRYSGINVKRIKLFTFMLMGFMSGLTAIFYIGRMGGGANSAMGTGIEMNAIAIVALGGVSAEGGSGKLYGPIIATFVIATLTYTLGLLGVDDTGKKIVTGIILILAVVLTNLQKNKK